MSDVLFVHRTQPSYLMTPVISVKADLVTQNKNYIYVPLASRTTYGSVKIGEGLNIEGGVLSFDKSEVSILTIAKNGEDIVPDENKRINIIIDKTDVGLSEVDNTSDADKPVSALQQIEFDKKIDIYQGKEYSERALVVGEDGYVQPRAISITLDKDVVNKISVGGQDDAVNIGYTTINLKSLVEKTSSVGLPLATDTSAGLMSISDYKSIRELQTRVNRIENRVSKLLYDDNLYPTAEEIDSFVSSLGYTQPYDNIGVLVSGTHHIWHYYDNVGWIDDGIDIVDQFTNTTAGVIKGSSVIGKIYAETDGTGSVNGWDSLVLKLEGLENASDNYVKKQGYQEVTGPIVFVESVGIKNEDGTIDYIKHINNNLLITTSTGTNLLNIDEGLSKVYFFNKEIAFKEDIGESSGTTVKVGGVAVAEFDADSKVDKTVKINGHSLTQNIVLTAEDVGALSDIPDWYVTTDTLNSAMEKKVDKVDGKGLSTNDFTNADKEKLAGLSNYNDSALSNRVAEVENNKANAIDLADVIDNKTAIGSDSRGTKLGYGSIATDVTSIAIGNRATTSKENDVAIGFNTTVAGSYSVGIGRDVVINTAARESVALGVSAKVGDGDVVKNAVQIGRGTNTQSNTLQIFGDNIYNHETHTMDVQNLNLNGTDLATTLTNLQAGVNKKPTPDYDSGWFNFEKGTTYTFTHNLGTINFFVLIDMTYDNGTNYFYHQNTLINPDGTGNSYAGGIEEGSRTTTKIYLTVAKNYAWAQSRAVNDAGGVYVDFAGNTNCKARMRLFKLGGDFALWK